MNIRLVSLCVLAGSVGCIEEPERRRRPVYVEERRPVVVEQRRPVIVEDRPVIIEPGRDGYRR